MNSVAYVPGKAGLWPACPVCDGLVPEPFREVEGKLYLRCPDCRATLLSPAFYLSEQEELAFYQLHDNRPDDPGYRRFLSKLFVPLSRKLEPGARGLDFGCGPGPALAAMFQEAGFAMALYDPFFVPDSQALGQTYDFVTCTEVVEHLHRPAEVFRQLDRLVTPGGWLGVMTCFQDDDARFDGWHYRRDPTHVTFYREHTFRYLARQYGWAPEVPAKDVVLFRKPDPGA